jgi:tRNA threonylcarbamoyladenosine biosynthesis protein TsaE
MALRTANYNKLEGGIPDAGIVVPPIAVPPIAVPGSGGYNIAMALPSPISAAEGGLLFRLSDATETTALAAALAPLARVGDVIALHGPLGAGKTAFARAFILACAKKAGLDDAAVGDVPSPTFTLVQTYDLTDPAIWHFDLYRLKGAEEAMELGIDDAFATAISLIEWPERLGSYLPGRALHLELEFDAAEGARTARLTGGGDWPARLERLI